ncbi:acyl-CoA carboxylase subunit beta [Thermodesulfobacteriota bacterium]
MLDWEREMKELEERRRCALLMGGEEKIARWHAKGRLTARERINRLLDPGTFMEIGMLNHSDIPGLEDKTPADSKIAGYGEIDGRTVAVIACDFTVLSSSTSRVSQRKERELKNDVSTKGFPLIYLGECGGGRIPDMMGSYGISSFGGMTPDGYLKSYSRGERLSPMIMAAMGECYGAATWMASMSDLVLQIKGSAIAVSGPRVLEIALSETVSMEELGGWKVHAETTGMNDVVVEDEEDCFKTIRQLLGYLPSHRDEFAPVSNVPQGAGNKMGDILKYLPKQRNQAYDMNRILKCVVDEDSLFPVKPLFGKNTITSLARVGGRVVGVVASQPMFGAGSIDSDGIDKAISFLCLCDSFNIPLVFFHDTPGFLAGREAERKRVAGKIINFNQALSLVTVPKISIVVRKSYGMAYNNMGGAGCRSDFLVAWPTAEISFVAPEIAANIVHGGKDVQGRDEKEEYDAVLEKIIKDISPYGAAGRHLIHDVIDPRETRKYIIKALNICSRSRSRGLSEHKLAAWPTKF